MKLYLGVDGGQSGTAAVIGDDKGRILGTGEAGPCNHAAAGEGRAKLERALNGSVAAACKAAGLNYATVVFEAACLGMSGGPEDKEAIIARIIESRRLLVTTDAVIALSGATESGQGIAVIAGTGSIAFGRNRVGRTARAGGWGYVFGDEGGAFDLVRQALRSSLRMDEGWGPRTILRDALVRAAGARNANDVAHRFYTPEWPRDKAAKLAPLVDQAAMAGDTVAQEILNNAAMHLAGFASAVRGQIFEPGESIEVACIGGVFASDALRERFQQLVELTDGARVVEPLRGPAEGALREAMRLT
jgi:N-acetylglucosamine kinase-like BadF-type ATPase